MIKYNRDTYSELKEHIGGASYPSFEGMLGGCIEGFLDGIETCRLSRSYPGELEKHPQAEGELSERSHEQTV